MKISRILAIAVIAIVLQFTVASTGLAATSEQGYGGAWHTVQYGETLFSIGRMYDVYPYAIAEANGMWNPDVIYAGQALYIPDGPPYYQCGDWDPCNNNEWDNSGWNNNGWDNSGWNNNGWDNCYDNCASPGYGNQQPCYGDNSGCAPQYNYGYGYDGAGYYYDAYYPGTDYGRYSYPCGQTYNCY
ncbi:LysM domain-containing protein [Anaerolineales bacterium HSG6]|nr:LysM domain-containing protein [Anaerolineales bacterium HSG6]MDM8531195.1 LysM domain-containing protein [Anaerolineales bacterium HSG25]